MRINNSKTWFEEGIYNCDSGGSITKVAPVWRKEYLSPQLVAAVLRTVLLEQDLTRNNIIEIERRRSFFELLYHFCVFAVLTCLFFPCTGLQVVGFLVGCSWGMDQQEGERAFHQQHLTNHDQTPVLREQRHVPRRPEESIPTQGDSKFEGLAVILQWMEQQRRDDAVVQEERLRLQRREDLERQEDRLRLLKKEEWERNQAEKERLERKELERDKAMRDHQLLMMAEQNKAEERRVGTSRESQNTDRRRQDAMFSVPYFKEKDNLEEFLQTAERRLSQGHVHEDSWVAIIADKLPGRLSGVWLSAAGEDKTFEEIKRDFLRVNGFTPKIAGETFFGFTLDKCKGLTAEQVYHKGLKLFRSMNAPMVPDPKLEFRTITAWLYHLVPKRAKDKIDSRTIKEPSDLIEAVSDYLMREGDMLEGATATFKQLSVENKKEFVRGNCFICGKPGHRASNCRQARGNESVKGNESAPKQWSKEGKEPYKIICFICQEEGHKAPQCPRKMVKEEQKEVGAKTRPLKRLRASSTSEVELPGKVNGMDVLVLLDSGAAVSVVPEHLVSSEQFTGETIWVKPFKAKEAYACSLALVPFSMGGMQWEEKVAVDSECSEEEGEILYCLNIRSERGLKLITYVNKMEEEAVVNRVTTRSEAKEKEKQEAEVALVVEKQKPKVKAVELGDHAVDRDPVEETMEVVEPRVSSAQLEQALQGLADENLVEEEQGVLVIPPVPGKEADVDRLVKLTEEDLTLKSWREKADKGDQDFAWGEGLLFQVTTNQLEEETMLLVLPLPLRAQVMQLAHEGMGHMGFKRVLVLIKQKFVWPGMGVDVRAHCESCRVCQMSKRQNARKAPLMIRPVLSEPFEAIAFDLVGPMDPGQGGCRFLLTAICMASRWPEAIPLRTVTAEDVAEGMFAVFSRTGLPLQLLTDQGPQFMSAIVKSMCKQLKVDNIRTAPYHPECNGMIERMHGTLNSMLTKASSLGLDWVKQVPFALFAMRLAPNRDTGLSPFQLVYGRQVRSPLDVLYEGWVDVELGEFDVELWSGWLGERMKVWSEVAREKGLEASAARKQHFDKKAVVRVLKPGDKVLCRIPGMIKKLRESWKGPYTVKKKLNDVDYLVEIRQGKSKVLHINNLKLFKEREEKVRRLTVVADCVDDDPDLAGVKMGDRCLGFDDKIIEELEAAYPQVFSDLPGRTDLCQLIISTVSEQPLAAHPHRVPDKWKEGVRHEVLKLEEQGIIVRSNSPWASPIVPVPKPDGSIRICIDYRRLNSITIKDPYYMVTLEEILDRVGNCGVVSKIDLTKGYYQIEVHPESMEKTTFVSFVGKFMFKRMPFGLANAPAIFQRVMERALEGCYQFSAPYIDDVIVFSGSVEEHTHQLGEVVRALSKAGLTIRKSKCVFGRRSVEYLGHRIGSGCLAVPEHRVTAMKEYVLPHTKRQLRAFLGAASYNRQFVYQFAWYSSALSPSTSLSAPAVVDWDDSKLKAFNHLKVSLCTMCILTIPSSEDEFCLHTDASAMGIGATLNVIRDNKELTVAFFSRQLHGAQVRYSATELEALAIIRSVFFFAHYLHGRQFVIITDHKALTSWMSSPRLNRRLQSWAMKLMDFSFTIKYRPGPDVGDADGLSRQAWAETGEDTSGFSQRGGDVGRNPTGRIIEGGSELSMSSAGTDSAGTGLHKL